MIMIMAGLFSGHPPWDASPGDRLFSHSSLEAGHGKSLPWYHKKVVTRCRVELDTGWNIFWVFQSEGYWQTFPKNLFRPLKALTDTQTRSFEHPFQMFSFCLSWFVCSILFIQVCFFSFVCSALFVQLWLFRLALDWVLLPLVWLPTSWKRFLLLKNQPTKQFVLL